MLPVYLIHYEAVDWLRSSIRSIQASTLPVSVTVIDNGGAFDVGVRTLRQGANRGYTGGANAALRDWLAGNEPWCVIGSHDLHVEPGTFAEMLAEAAPRVGVIGPTLSVGSAGGSDANGVTWLSGTCLMIRRECALDVGPFDELFASYVEDVDWGWRARAAGWQLVKSDAVATGVGSAAGRLAMTRAIRARTIYLLWKHRGLRSALGSALHTARHASRAAGKREWKESASDFGAICDGFGLCLRAVAARHGRAR